MPPDGSALMLASAGSIIDIIPPVPLTASASAYLIL